MRLWALSDLHVSHPENRQALACLPAYPDDWLIVAGDVGHGVLALDWCFRQLTPKFRQVVWVPGNHDLWTVPRDVPRLAGGALYERLVQIARGHGVITPEDPYPVVDHRDGAVLIAPLFLLYDYSFRPPHVGRDEVVGWARQDGAVCSDEFVLHPDPYPDRESWCAARCEAAASRLAACPADLPKVLVNHFRSKNSTPCCPASPASRRGAEPAVPVVGTAASTPARWCTATSTSAAPGGWTECRSRRYRSAIRGSGIAGAGSTPTCAKWP